MSEEIKRAQEEPQPGADEEAAQEGDSSPQPVQETGEEGQKGASDRTFVKS